MEPTNVESIETETAPASDAAPSAKPPITLGRRLAAGPSFGSALVALVLWWESLRPSMLPRSWLIQGAVGALCVSFGVAIGGAAQRLIGSVLRRTDTAVPAKVRSVAVRVLAGLAAVAVIVGSVRWFGWQRDHRHLIHLSAPSVWSVAPMLVTTLLLTALLLVISRIVKHVVYRIDRAAASRLPAAWSRWIVIAALVVVVVVGSGVAMNQFAKWSDTNFGSLDTDTAEGITVPTTGALSGGPGSLVRFGDLGYQGRTFVAGGPTIDEIRAFWNGADVKQPIRAYVGLKSADTLAARVQLAVDELQRAGGFQRKVLVVATPTGTGWINPNAAQTLEYMWGGDTAIVGVQYSFLPSWVATLVDTKSAPALGAALFDAVHAEWAKLPADSRPKLVAFGESLGSFAGEQAFAVHDKGSARANAEASVQSIVSQTDAALFVGPTRDNPIFGALVDQRDAGSRSWAPTWASLPNLRVANQTGDITADASAWPTPRVLYLHHPSDAVGTWEAANLWRNPGWADDPAPYDIPSAARWTPLVSIVQETMDLMNGFSASPGFGHDYRNNLTAAWAAIIPPAGWTNDDTQRLDTLLGL